MRLRHDAYRKKAIEEQKIGACNPTAPAKKNPDRTYSVGT